jgi:O-antigen ligase
MLIIVQSMAVVIALILLPGFLFHFDVTPKLTALLAGTSLCLLFFRKNYVHLRAFVTNRRGLLFTGLLLGELAWASVAAAASSSPQLALYGASWRRLGLITFAAVVVLSLLCAARMSGSPSQICGFLRVVVLTGLPLSTYGILQYFGVDPLIPAQTYRAGEGQFEIVRPPGSFGHADYFATWLVFVVFAAVTVIRVDSNRWMRIAGGTTAAVTTIAIVLTGTRAALLGLVAGIVVLTVLRVLPPKRVAIASIAAIAILFVFVLSPAGARVRARIHWSGDDRLGGARLLIWRDSLKMASNHPITGFGPDTFALIFPRYESTSLARAYPDFYHESPHNVLLDELTAKGSPGLFLFLALVLVALWPGSRLQPADPLSNCLSALLVSLFVCQQFSVFVVGTAFAFYLAAAMLVAAKTCPQGTGLAPAIWFAIPALALSAVFGVYAIRLTGGDYDLARAASAIANQNSEAAARELNRAVVWLPPGDADDLYFSRSMAAIGAWREAIHHAVRAVTASEDRQNAWYSLAAMLAQQNDSKGVEQCLRNAIAWAPNWFKPHWKLAEVLALSGRRSEALIEARKAFDLDGEKDAEVTATFHELCQ